MPYDDLVKRLRASVDGRYEKCDGCPYEEDYPCCVDCLDKMHKQAADAIENLSKLNAEITKRELKQRMSKPRLIPVTEQLPEEDGDYLVWFYDAACWKVCEFNKHTAKERHVWWFAGVDRTKFVTHWMLLPEPPKEE